MTVTVHNAGPPPPVEAPVWQQGWFWVLVVVILGGAFLGYRYVRRRARRRGPEE